VAQNKEASDGKGPWDWTVNDFGACLERLMSPKRWAQTQLIKKSYKPYKFQKRNG